MKLISISVLAVFGLGVLTHLLALDWSWFYGVFSGGMALFAINSLLEDSK